MEFARYITYRQGLFDSHYIEKRTCWFAGARCSGWAKRRLTWCAAYLLLTYSGRRGSSGDTSRCRLPKTSQPPPPSLSFTPTPSTATSIDPVTYQRNERNTSPHCSWFHPSRFDPRPSSHQIKPFFGQCNNRAQRRLDIGTKNYRIIIGC